MKSSGVTVALSLIGLALFSAILPAASAAERPLRILILSGQNNHDWASTTPRLKAILAGTGRFDVAVTEHPEACDSSSFQGYDALLSNWNKFGSGAKDWPPKMRQAFLEFVRQGHGLISIHAGSSSFTDWKEYQDLVGGTWGPETGHGPMHRFEVKIADATHPITRGFPPFQTTDELWHRTLTRPGIHVLATAFSSAKQGGSGKDEPIAFVTDFGKGHCFNLLLGHDVKAMESAGFQALLARAAEWAASGKVTLPAPSIEAAAGWNELLEAAARYEATGSRATLQAVEKIVADAAARPELRAALARQLAARLASPATLEARQFFCWQLSLIGSAEQVPAIAPLLADTNLAYYARLALERIPGDASFNALRKTLPNSSGSARLGLISSLANRGDTRAAGDLVVIARGPDSEAAIAAVRALGQLGGPDALKALAKTKPVSPALVAEIRQAQLRCAASLVRAGKSREAAPVLETLLTSAETPALRSAAFQLWTSALGEKSAPRVLAALVGEDPILRQAAVQSLKSAEMPLLSSAAQSLNRLTPEMQVTLLAILAERQAAPAQANILKLLASKDAAVRLAAIRCLGALGDAAAVPPLTALLAAADRAERSAITVALASLPGEGVGSSLLEVLNSGAPEVKVAAIQALAARASKPAIPAFSAAATNASPEVRREAIRALGQLAEANACPPLIALLPTASPQDAEEIQSALAEICRRAGTVAPLVDALRVSPPAARPALLNALAAVGSPDALAAIQAQLTSTDQETRLAAIRVLTEWPDPAPAQALGSVLLTATDNRSRALALRGLSRMAPQVKGPELAATIDCVGRVFPGANTNEQVALLAALGDMASPASLKLAASHLADPPPLAPAARTAVYKILDDLGNARRAEVLPTLELLKRSATDPAELARLEALDLKFGDLQKLSAGATASSSDGLQSDGQGGPPAAAIDGKTETYWDQVDNQKFYSIRVDLKQPSVVALIKIQGFQQHNFAPRDFEIFGDDKLLKKVEGAQYTNNWWQTALPGARCGSIELRITGYYGPSPAIRELEIYGTPAQP